MTDRDSGVFITGTDTGVGKTLIGCALLDLLKSDGISTAAFKPVAAGARETPAGLRNDDAERLMARATASVSYAGVNPVTLAPAIAPHIAARQAGIRIDIERLAAAYAFLRGRAQFVVVEGAGGWLVPLGPRQTMADLALRLDLPVLLVVGLRLGCLNHALLTVENIETRGLDVAGWIANQVQRDMPAVEDNITTLRARIPAPLLGHVGWLGDRRNSDLPIVARAGLDSVGIRDALL